MHMHKNVNNYRQVEISLKITVSNLIMETTILYIYIYQLVLVESDHYSQFSAITTLIKKYS